MNRFRHFIPPTFGMILLAYALVLGMAMMVFSSCALSRESAPPDLLPEWDRLELAEQAAQATPDPADDQAVEEQFAELESRISKRQAQPFADLLPYGLGALALEVVGAVGSRRKRKLYGSAIKSISSGQLAQAAGDALKAWGVQHSSPQPPPPQPPS